MYKGYTYTSKFGIMEKDSYPYSGHQSSECKFDKEKVVFKNLGMV